MNIPSLSSKCNDILASLLNNKPDDVKERLYNGLNNKKAVADLKQLLPIVYKLDLGIKLYESDYITLMQILNHGINFHQDGKIGGAQSLDSTATACDFCAGMRKAAEKDDDIVCGKCYDVAQEKFKKFALARHFINLVILSRFNIPMEYFKLLEINTSVFRFNSSGDIENFIHASNLVKIAMSFPAVNFGLWSKHINVVTMAFDIYGKPENIRFIQSVCRIDGNAVFSKYANTCFVVARPENVDSYINTGCNECNGKKCAACGWKCYLPENSGGWSDGTVTVEKLR